MRLNNENLRRGESFLKRYNTLFLVTLLISLHIPYLHNFGTIKGYSGILILQIAFSSFFIILHIFLCKLKRRDYVLITLFISLVLFNFLFHWQFNSSFIFSEYICNFSIVLLNLFLINFLSSNSFSIDESIFSSVYKFLLLINSLLIISQFCALFFLRIPFFSVWQFFYGNLDSFNILRPCGLAKEPAHFGLFCLGILTDKNGNKIGYRIRLLCISSLILTFSAISIFVATLVLMQTLCQSSKNRLLLILVPLFLIFSILVHFSNEQVLSRTINSFTLSKKTSSINSRIYKPFAILPLMDYSTFLCGLGPGNLDNIYNKYGLTEEYKGKSGEGYWGGAWYEFFAYGFFPSLIINIILAIAIKYRCNSSLFFIGFLILRFIAQLGVSSFFLPIIICLSNLFYVTRRNLIKA